MRHSRSGEFRAALGEAGQRQGGRWQHVASDPNAAAALAWRAETLRAAWRAPVPDRAAFLEQRCRGRTVLDIGCVAHDAARMASPEWLHGRLARVATTCVGVDVVPEGIEAMRRAGFRAVLHDLSDGLGPLAADAPYDVVVAGELVEHLETLGTLFATAATALSPDGQLLVTTPNPYAPHRVRAAQLGIVWENVDHVLYAFPAGVAELAERHGLVLTEAATTALTTRLGLVARLKAVRRRVHGRQWATVGYTTLGPRGVRRVGFGPVGRLLHGMWWPGRRFLGETFVYVLRRTGT